jgi:transcriptional regulator of aromatic amino acid metabolism
MDYNKDIIFEDRVDIIKEVDDMSVVSSLDGRNSILDVINVVSLESPHIMRPII